MFRLVSCLILSAVIILFLVTPTADVKIPEPIVLPIDFFWATAYSMGEVTRSGLPVDMGIVAVDPAKKLLNKKPHRLVGQERSENYESNYYPHG